MPKSPGAFRMRPAEPRAPEARGSARDRGYNAAWDRASAAYRREHPRCEYCLSGAFGPRRSSPTTCVDHLYPHRRFKGVFWRREWWVASCGACHSGPKQAAEGEGRTALDCLAALLGRPTLGSPGAGVG